MNIGHAKTTGSWLNVHLVFLKVVQASRLNIQCATFQIFKREKLIL